MTKAQTTPQTDFDQASVDLCQTPQELVQSNLFTKVLEKTLEPQDVQYIQAIVNKRVAGKELNTKEQHYLSTIQSDEELLDKFNNIINTIEYISKKKWSDMKKKQNLPHFDDRNNADAGKVLTWLQGWVVYIDTLIQKNKNLAPKSLAQLNMIKELYTKHNPTMDLPERLRIQNNLVCIDWNKLPTRVTPLSYKELADNTLPEYAKELLTFAADITGTIFNFPSHWDELQDKSIDGASFEKEINTDNNRSIIKTLHSIVWFNSLIPVWQDSDGCIISVGIRPENNFSFYRYKYDNKNCLVPWAK
jgi:hypothetical protein